MKKNLRVGFLITAIGLTAVLSIANIQAITVNYLFGTFKLPLILLILISVALGMLIQFLLGFSQNMSLRQEIKELRAHHLKVADAMEKSAAEKEVK